MKEKIKFLLVLLFCMTNAVMSYSTIRHISTKNEFMSLGGTSITDSIYIDNDIDLENELFIPITSFKGEFNGQGYSVKGLNIDIKNGDAGLIKSVSNSYIHNFSIYGKITNTSSKELVKTGLICCISETNDTMVTTLKNIENHVSIYVTSPRASIAGFVVNSSIGQLYIKQCQYCDTIHVKPTKLSESTYGGYYVFGQCAGIIGTIKINDLVSDCLYDGHIHIDVPYNPEPIVNIKNNNTVEGYNYDGNLGGIVGYAGSAVIENRGECGVKNCLSTGTFNLNGNWFKNQGAISGIISSKVTNNNNYFCNDTITVGTTSTSRPLEGSNSKNPGQDNSTLVTEEEIANGSVYDSINNNGGDNWGQYPNVKYKCENGNYTLGYLSFNDDCDETIFPKDAASIYVNTIKYKRASKYVKGVMSVCLPFEVSKTDGTLPDGIIYEYSHAEKDMNGNVTSVHFKKCENQNSIPAGEAVFFSPLNENIEWDVVKTNSYVYNEPAYGVLSTNVHQDRVGINGSFNTTKLGSGYFKLNGNGDNLVYTTQTSNCYPYRCYVKLPNEYIVPTGTSSSQTQSRLNIIYDNDDMPTHVEKYNKITTPEKIIKNGHLFILKNGRLYTIGGICYE